MMLKWYMNSRLCHMIHHIFYYAPSAGRARPGRRVLEWDELILALADKLISEKSPSVFFQSLNNCIRKLEAEGIIEQEHEYDSELKACIESITDRRVKDKVKYCLKKKMGRVTNIIYFSEDALRDWKAWLEREYNAKLY